MKTLFIQVLKNTLLLVSVILVTDCQPAKEPAPAATGGSSTSGGSTGSGSGNTAQTGTATFFTKEDLGVGSISVSVDGKAEGTIAHYHASGVTCGQGDVNVTKPAGTYPFKATGGSLVWEGTVTIKNGICQAQELQKSASGGGSSTATGQVTFWTAQSSGWSSIDVSVGGTYVGSLSKSYASVPACGASGCVTITKAPGTYSFTAKSNEGTTWSGNVTVSANGCATNQLTLTPSSGGGSGSTACDWNTYSTATALGIETYFSVCGSTKDGLNIKVTNKTGIRLECKFCLEHKDGTWDCGASAIRAGDYTTYWSCHNTGKYKVWAMSEDLYQKNNCPYPKP